MRITRARSCTGKQRFETKRAAEGQRWALIRDRGATPGQYASYKCGFCGQWHVGHPVKVNGRRR